MVAPMSCIGGATDSNDPSPLVRSPVGISHTQNTEEGLHENDQNMTNDYTSSSVKRNLNSNRSHASNDSKAKADFDQNKFKCQTSLLGLQSELIEAYFFKSFANERNSFMVPYVRVTHTMIAQATHQVCWMD